MIGFFYQLFLILAFIFWAPFWMGHFLKGKYQISPLYRLGKDLRFFKKKKPFLIWIHAVSVGETKAVASLVDKLKVAFPEAEFVMSHITETGLSESRRSFPDFSHLFLLPFDFYFINKKLVKNLSPDIFLLVETDFWYGLLQQLKKQGTYIFLVNGKISDKSFARFQFFKAFSTSLFSFFDHFFIQDELYAGKFSKLGIPLKKITISGNLKNESHLDIMNVDRKETFLERLCISPNEKVIVLASTHEGEEEKLLDALPSDLICRVLVVPRHPQRFHKVFSIMQKYDVKSALYSQTIRDKQRLILIDAMGVLQYCYQIADLVILGGSFIEGIGGHNLIEPLSVGTPVFIGPHTFAQKEMVRQSLHYKAVKQMDEKELKKNIKLCFKDENMAKSMKIGASHFMAAQLKSSQIVCSQIKKLCLNQE